MADLKRLQTAVEVGDRETAVEVTEQAIAEDIPPKTILDAMTDAMGVVGQRFQDNEIYVPEMLISARAMKAAVALLEPLLDRLRLQAGQRRGHGHHQGRPPRHRQEPRGHDAQGRQLRDLRPGHQRVRRQVHGRRPRAQGGHHRHQRPADHDDGRHAHGHRGGPRRRGPAAPARHGRRRGRDQGVRETIGADGWAPDAGSAVILARLSWPRPGVRRCRARRLRPPRQRHRAPDRADRA